MSSPPLAISFCITDDSLLIVTQDGSISLFVADPEQPSVVSGAMALPLFPFDELDKTSQNYDFYSGDISI